MNIWEHGMEGIGTAMIHTRKVSRLPVISALPKNMTIGREPNVIVAGMHPPNMTRLLIVTYAMNVLNTSHQNTTAMQGIINGLIAFAIFVLLFTSHLWNNEETKAKDTE